MATIEIFFFNAENLLKLINSCESVLSATFIWMHYIFYSIYLFIYLFCVDFNFIDRIILYFITNSRPTEGSLFLMIKLLPLNCFNCSFYLATMPGNSLRESQRRDWLLRKWTAFTTWWKPSCLKIKVGIHLSCNFNGFTTNDTAGEKTHSKKCNLVL